MLKVKTTHAYRIQSIVKEFLDEFMESINNQLYCNWCMARLTRARILLKFFAQEIFVTNRRQQLFLAEVLAARIFLPELGKRAHENQSLLHGQALKYCINIAAITYCKTIITRATFFRKFLAQNFATSNTRQLFFSSSLLQPENC